MAEIFNTVPVIGTSIDLKLLERALTSKNIQLKPEYSTLVTQLLNKHATGMLHYSIATNSFELRIPDPNLLVQDGFKELSSKHLYVNLTKYIEAKHIAPARCVKTGQVYTMESLLNMPPLNERSLEWDVEYYLKKYRQKTLIIPKSTISLDPNLPVDEPGDCIPITELPENHVAIQYLYDRGFSKDDLPNLYKQFKVSYCVKSKHNFYTDLYQGLSKSPLGKLIFFIYHFGKLKGWQSRRIEKQEGNTIYHWMHHPEDTYKTGWIPVAKVEEGSHKPIPLPDVPKSVLDSKYVIGFGTRASDCLLGFDAAKDNGHSIVLVEGALDAAKFGIPACSVFGCRVSKAQAELLCNNFEKIYFIKDHDSAGEQLEASLKQEFLKLNSLDKLQEISYSSQYKDIGEINDIEYLNTLRTIIN